MMSNELGLQIADFRLQILDRRLMNLRSGFSFQERNFPEH